MRQRCARESRRGLGGAWLLAASVTLAGCSGLTENDVLPPDVRDPAEMRTPEGAVAAYNGVRLGFRRAFHVVVRDGGLLTDELGSNEYGEPVFGQPATLDRRFLPEGGAFSAYDSLHMVRRDASEAIGLLATYAPDAPPALRGHAYALAGYAELFLADLYCSGIPLSTVDFAGDFTPRPGSTTAEVYAHAVALFDTAATLAADSARVLDLARVGRGRALLALGRYAEAGQAVAAVPDGFSYAVQYDANDPSFLAEYFDPGSVAADQIGATVTDGEGGNGLPYLSSGDPRLAAVHLGDNKYGFPIYAPAKYALDGTGPMVLADWVEARLIEAEVALQAGDPATWLGKLNHLRQTAISPALPDTTDPGVDGAGGDSLRVDLFFRERAFWLFLTGHRQGDLRRLARMYGRDPESVYPSGAYPDGQGIFGTDVTVPVPRQEQDLNPLYTGCFGRGA